MNLGRPSTEAALSGASIESLAVPVPSARLGSTVAAVRESIQGQRHGSVSHVVLVNDEGQFAGLVRDVDLMAAAPTALIDQLAIGDPPAVTPTATRDEAAWAALSRGESEVVVVDPTRAPIGIVPSATLLAVLFREHSDDMARLSGYLHQGATARAATEESVRRRFLHRLPWLIFGLIGAGVAAQLVAGFEQQLQKSVALAFFLPGIVYLADAVGTQTEAVVIRGLSLGVSIRRIAARELATGVVLGAALGVLFFPAALAMLDDMRLAVAVAISLGMASAIANLVALAVPWMLQRAGRDPAFGSGLLATVVQDLLSITIYLFTVTTVGS